MKIHFQQAVVGETKRNEAKSKHFFLLRSENFRFEANIEVKFRSKRKKC